MTPTSVGEIGNFSVKWGVNSMAPRVFRDDLPSIMWYGARESITKYLTSIVLMFSLVPKVVLYSMTPKTLTHSLEKPTGSPLYRLRLDS